ncbi:hypothetical protein A7X92_03780 [Stenotrophomonas maltophilia]|nr:hypothetical protein A7X92_03780 [Stenotrophomonas maltophilia]
MQALNTVLPTAPSSSNSSSTPNAEAVATVAALGSSQAMSSTPSLPSSAEPLSEPQSAYLWEFWKQMTAMFPGKWERENGAAPFKKDGSLTIAAGTWFQVLKGRSRAQHARGMACCLTEGREWPPNPPRFLTMCLDIPVMAAVEREMAPGRPQSGFTVLVRSLLDLHVYASADHGSQQRRMLEEAYTRAVQHVVDGKPLPQPVLAIEQERHGVRPVRDRESARAAMERAAAELNFDGD